MAGSVNKVILVGNLGKDPEVRRMTSGEPVVTSESKAITLPATQTAAAYFKTASYEELYFDTALPTKPGQNLDTAIANYFSSPNSGNAAAIANSPQTP